MKNKQLRARLVRRSRRQHRSWFVGMGIVFTLLFALLEATHVGPIDGLDHFFLDTALIQSADHKQASQVVVVDVDEMSLAAVGQWPWPRYKVATLISAIAKPKPSAIGLDLLFPEADRTSLSNIQTDFKREFGIDISFSGAPSGLSDNDGYLGSVISETGAVAANYFYFDNVTRTEYRSPTRPTFSGALDTLSLVNPTGMMSDTPAIASQTDLTGYLNTQPDADGRVRRLPLLMKYHGAIYGDLALATVMKSLGVSSASVAATLDGPVIQVGDRAIPIDKSGNALLRFSGGPEFYRSISAVDVLNGKFKPTDFAGKIVFIGSSAAGLSDLHSTAFDPFFSGLKIQAVMAQNILSRHFVSIPAWSGTAILIECLVTGLFLTALFSTAGGATVTVGGSILVSLIPVLIGLTLFDTRSEFLSPSAPLLLAATLMVVFSIVRFSFEQRLAFARLKGLENSRQVTIESMAAVAETRDPETGAHIKRTQHYVKAIAEELHARALYADVLNAEFIDMLFLSAPLHDIGKVGVPDHILLKAGRLTEEEFVIMKQHAEFGRRIILSTSQLIEGDNYLNVAADIAGSHHEKWDGTGYPLGLAGEDIPIAGRIMAVADIYDALISRRCYKEPFPHLSAAALMREARGTTFDPVILDVFFSIESTILEIAARYSDEDAPASAPPASESLSRSRRVEVLTETTGAAIS
jgi:HD-GYP domain-containing protein (c-di-GMP phosphodiesterase class II)